MLQAFHFGITGVKLAGFEEQEFWGPRINHNLSRCYNNVWGKGPFINLWHKVGRIKERQYKVHLVLWGSLVVL